MFLQVFLLVIQLWTRPDRYLVPMPGAFSLSIIGKYKNKWILREIMKLERLHSGSKIVIGERMARGWLTL